MIQHRLLDWYGIDTGKNLGIRQVCGRPSDTLLIDKQGYCYACECQSWLPVPIGNLYKNNLEDILDSERLKKLQASVADGSFRYCNDQQCSYIKDRNIPSQDSRFILRLAIDDSCNLSCPSCRIKNIFLGKGKMLEMRMVLADKILQYLINRKGPIRLHLGSDGDPFASLVYRYILRNTRKLKNINYTITTNGLLINKMYQRLPELFDRLETLNMSVDGATPQTYESLRRNASWPVLLKNLEFVKKIKTKYNFEFIIHMVVQNKNYHEMHKMIDLARAHGADRVWFNRITDWNVLNDFVQHDVADPVHHQHKDFMIQFQKLKETKKLSKDIIINMPTLYQLNS